MTKTWTPSTFAPSTATERSSIVPPPGVPMRGSPARHHGRPSARVAERSTATVRGVLLALATRHRFCGMTSTPGRRRRAGELLFALTRPIRCPQRRGGRLVLDVHGGGVRSDSRRCFDSRRIGVRPLRSQRRVGAPGRAGAPGVTVQRLVAVAKESATTTGGHSRTSWRNAPLLAPMTSMRILMAAVRRAAGNRCLPGSRRLVRSGRVGGGCASSRGAISGGGAVVEEGRWRVACLETSSTKPNMSSS